MSLQNVIVSVLIVNFNTSEFIRCSLYALSKLTKNPYKVYIIDNGSCLRDFKKLLRYAQNYENVTIHRRETKLRGSIAHGTALNELTKMIDTPYFSILDADAIWLRKNWDEILINKITSTTKVIGTQAPPPKPQDFPLMFAILFETNSFKKLDIDFCPRDFDSLKDTGWELKEKYQAAGLSGSIIEFKNTRFYKKGPFAHLPAVGEYYLEGDYSRIFASHFGRGSNPLGKQTIQSFNRLARIFFMPINYILWFQNQVHWINQCYRLINSQC